MDFNFGVLYIGVFFISLHYAYRIIRMALVSIFQVLICVFSDFRRQIAQLSLVRHLFYVLACVLLFPFPLSLVRLFLLPSLVRLFLLYCLERLSLLLSHARFLLPLFHSLERLVLLP